MEGLGLDLPLPERERAYSPSSCIGGDYRPFVAAYRERSDAARNAARALGARWQRVWPAAAPHPAIELCRPAVVARGLLVFIHGGYWQELSAADSLFPAAACVERGWAFAAIDYGLAPQHPVHDIIEQCRAAVRWLGARSAALGWPVDRIVVSGSSAGAHLAAMVGLAQPELHALVLVSGVYWLEPLVGTTINEALGLDAASARALSPALQPLAAMPPALIACGAIETDTFKQQGRSFAQALRAAGARVDLLEVPQRNHFDVILDLADAATALGRATHRLFGPQPVGG